ncbi:MAG TPA: serine/threonine-protein kinase [Polyangiaceae bacterium]|nr:serine/threonine-protein kinase [Polyangiaceae bacterium]
MPTQDPFIGREILNGQFQILQKVGSGGMGAVYKARQVEMNRMVGVKLLHPRLVNRKDLVSRFRREARALSQLAHPNTVKVFLYGELDDGSLYIIMEFLEGKNLNQTVRAEGPFSMDRALPILIQVCGALHEAHLAGIIHRDLKPENIFLVQSGGLRDFPKVLDFGLAKLADRQMRPGSVALTQEGMVFGTPEFMSPEQAQGKTLTPASDVYSLAVILYEVLTGKLPFDARSSMDHIHMHATAQPIRLNERVAGRTFPAPLEDLVQKALAKSPEERFASAAEFSGAMQSMIDGSARPVSVGRTDLVAASAQARSTGVGSASAQARSAGIAPVQSSAITVPSRKRVDAVERPPSDGSPRNPRSGPGGSARPNFVVLVVVAIVFLALGAGAALVLIRFASK